MLRALFGQELLCNIRWEEIAACLSPALEMLRVGDRGVECLPRGWLRTGSRALDAAYWGPADLLETFGRPGSRWPAPPDE